ncbi:MAG: uncharacterized membrane protein YgdD (TMEM256/DUF423 family) [Candidatus Azotimanducaceae bacterium]|jgi:uncharacterized membrane protein YgdD (TMEM256/DUF423 family)
MTKYFFLFAALSGFCSVACGAFGAHALEGVLEPRMLAAFKTGTQYQMSHTLVLLLALLFREVWRDNRQLLLACYSFAGGIILFSGSLYLITLTGISWFGPITPIGGLLLLSGWLFLAVGTWRNANV